MAFQDMAYFRMLARYNRWANARLYAACLALSPQAYNEDRRGYFKSIGNTLNHLLVVDRLWLGRIEGRAHGVTDLSAVPHPDRDELWAARQAMDEHIVALFAGYDDTTLGATLHYRDMSDSPKEVPFPAVFAHFFNHHTHHRGQVHGMLSHAGMKEPPPLDVIYYFHEMKDGGLGRRTQGS
jgi:uncharacterized damage-inducible protein DinB